jgi:hypothetical protein
MNNGCHLPICTPGAPVCNGQMATICNADGTEGEPGGTSCSDQGKFCHLGVCRECWPTTYFCSAGIVRHCSADGSSSTLSTTCTSSQYCDGVTGSCKPQVCKPSQPVCNGDVATTCKADGSGTVSGGTSCKDAGKSCQQGACVALACSPGLDFCSEGAIRHCADDGKNSTLTSSCTVSKYCDGATATCRPRACTPGRPVCLGEWPTTCNADGSGYLAGKTQCQHNGTTQPNSGVCVEGACTVTRCSTPGKYYCMDQTNRVMSCWSDQTAHPSGVCEGSSYCDSATASCQPLPCTSDQPACAGNSATMCGHDGQSFVGDSKPCGTQHCVDGTCMDALFAEGFEKETLVGWQAGSPVWAPNADGSPVQTRAITNALAAAGSRSSLMLASGSGDSSSINGISRAFDGIKPSKIGWWVLSVAAGDDGCGYTTLISSLSPYKTLAVSYFTKDGTLVIAKGNGMSTVAIPIAANVWYHIELRNLDWTAQTFDYYVNDTLILAAVPFGAESPNGIASLLLGNPKSGTAYWDEILIE